MSGIVLIGGGGHCRSVADTVKRTGKYENIYIVDPNLEAGSGICGAKVAGGDEVLPELYEKGITLAHITVGSISSTVLRHKLYEKAKEIGFSFPNIIDPSAIVADDVTYGAGIFVGKHTVVNSDAILDDCCIINTGSIVEHCCRIGSFTHVAVGATVCGDTSIGNDSLVGAGSTVIQGLHIGSNVIVGAGAVVTGDVSDNHRVVGVPAQCKCKR